MYKELFLLLPPLRINVFHVTVALLARDTYSLYLIEQQLNKSNQAATYRTKSAAHP